MNYTGLHSRGSIYSSIAHVGSQNLMQIYQIIAKLFVSFCHGIANQALNMKYISSFHPVINSYGFILPLLLFIFIWLCNAANSYCANNAVKM